MQADAMRIIAGKNKFVIELGVAVSSVRYARIQALAGPFATSLASLIPLFFQLPCVPANSGMGHESA
jgi:hypothetical protein